MALTTETPAPPRAGSDPPRAVETRVARLNAVSSSRVVEPDTHLPWGTLGDGQVIPDELLSVEGLGVALDAAQRARLAREELASMLLMGVRFEATLTAGFARKISEARSLADPRITYMLHEVGEEARHSRAFLRLVGELAPIAVSPFERAPFRWLGHVVTRSLARADALLLVMILAGEEIPDLLQRYAAEHPDTDPLVAALNRYHRTEEARHLAFARATLAEAWARSPAHERFRVRHVAPLLIGDLFATFVHPGVYETVGLPGWKTWRSVQRLPQRVRFRREATRPILAALLDAGVLRPGRIPRGWRRLCGVDRRGGALAV